MHPRAAGLERGAGGARADAAHRGSIGSTLRLVLSSTVAADLAAPYVHVEPQTAYRLSAERNALVLSGAFEPGATYRVRVDSGLPANDGATLRQPYDARVRLDNLPASVAFQSRGMFLSRGGLRNLALETVNVGRLNLAVDRVYRNNLFLLLQGHGDFDQEEVYPGGGIWRPLGDRLYEETVAIGGQRNRTVTTVLSLDDYVDADQPGLYRVLAGRPDHWQAPQRWVLVTDLGAVAKQGDGEFLVWALSHRTLAPVAGAEVELISDQNQVIARGRTDGEGFWRFRDAAALAEQQPFLVTLAKGDDFSFVYLDRMRVDTTGLDVGGARRPVDGYTAFLYGERDLYRPGETVRGVALVRDARLRPAPAMPALLRHRDSQGREIQTRRLELDGRGLAEFDWPMPAYAMTGRQSLELEIAEVVVGRYAFQLEEFVPDRIKVEIRPPAATPASRRTRWPTTSPAPTCSARRPPAWRPRAACGWSTPPSPPIASRSSPSATPTARSATARSSAATSRLDEEGRARLRGRPAARARAALRRWPR